MSESWEELSLVSSSPTMIRKGIEGVVMKHVSKAAKQQKGIHYTNIMQVTLKNLYTTLLSSRFLFLLFHLLLFQLICANHLRCPLRRPAPKLSPSPRGSSCASSVCRSDIPVQRLPRHRLCIFSVSSSCKSSVQCWLIHLCMCSMFHNAQHLGDTHCYALVGLPHRSPRALHNQHTVRARLCTGRTEEVKQA